MNRLVRSVVLASGVAIVVIGVSFSGSAYRIDEPNILEIARQIRVDKWDPYGFEINWLGTPQQAYEVLANPPLVPYFLALFAVPGGFDERILRVAMLPFALLLLIAVSVIEKERFPESGFTPILLVTSPVFILTSLVVMPDMAAAALSAGAIALTLRGIRADSNGTTILAMVSAGAAPLTKYNAIVIVLPLAILAWRRKSIRAALVAISPIVSLAAWGVIGWSRYGDAHILLHARSQSAATVFPLTGILVLCGMVVVSPFFCGLLFRVASGRVRSIALLAGTAGAVSAVALQYELVPLLLLVVGTVAGVLLLLSPLSTPTRERDDFWWMTIAWMLAAFFFQFNQLFTASRYSLPLLAPCALMLVSGARMREMKRTAQVAIFGLAFMFTLSLAVSDVSEGNLYRELSLRATKASRGGPLLFSGHWGAQWYLERAGARQIDASRVSELGCGETLVSIPEALAEVRSLRVAAGCSERREIVSVENPWPIRTVSCGARANFYGNAVGNCDRYPLLLPFGFSHESDFFVLQQASFAAR